MKLAFFCGSFNPWHSGHDDILEKALKIFDKVIVVQLSNSEKSAPQKLEYEDLRFGAEQNVEICYQPNISITVAIGNYILGIPRIQDNQYAMIRGLRNEKDFCDEQNLQYWYEDLGVKMPIMYIISDRSLVQISSSAIRMVKKANEGHTL